MDKNIFNEAIPTIEQKARLKKRIFEEQTEAQDNKMKKVSPFKTAAAVAAAFVLVVGAVALVAIVTNMGGTGIYEGYAPQNSSKDNPENIPAVITDLRLQYPQYFDLDTTKGLVVYAWFSPQIDDVDQCVLVPGKNIGYTDDEILSMPAATVSQMKEILKSYNVSNDKISVAFFKHPSLATAEYDADSFLNKICKELGIENKVQDLSERYPQYFNLDAEKGLLVYARLNSEPEFEYCLVPYTSTEYTDDEIAALEGVTIDQMKEILASYIVSPESVSVRCDRRLSTAPLYEADIRKQLGIEFHSDVQMNVDFKNETEFDVTFLHSTDNCTHKGEYQVDPEYSIWLDYEGERITYQEYARRTGMELDIGPLVWNTVIYKLEDDKDFVMGEDLLQTYGKLPAGKYYLEKWVCYKPLNGDALAESLYTPFEIKVKPTLPDDQKDTVVNIINGVDVRLGDGEFYEYYDFIYSFDFAIVYDTPHNFYHDTFTENGGDIPHIPTTDGNTAYKTIKVGDKLSPDFTVTEAHFNSNIKKDSEGNIIALDPKMSENKLRAEGNTTVTAYAYKQKYDNGTSEVMIIIDPRKDMNGEIALYRLFRERLYDFRYVSDNGGLFEATSSSPVMKLSEVDSEKFDKDGLWEIELDITAINMVYTERGGQSYISPEISDLRFIKEVEVSDPVAE